MKKPKIITGILVLVVAFAVIGYAGHTQIKEAYIKEERALMKALGWHHWH